MIEARRAADFIDSVGVCTHFGWLRTTYTEHFEALKEALAYARIKYVRDDLGYAPPRLLDLNRTLGIKACVIIDNIGTKDWHNRRLPVEVAATAVATALAELRGAIAYLEGPNEYDGTSKTGNATWMPELRAFQGALYAAAKAACDLPVIAPSMWRTNNFATLDDLSTACDRVNLHCYSGENPHGRIVDRDLALARVVNPAKPVVVTEYGWHTAMQEWEAHPLTETAKARYLPRALASLFVRPEIERAFIYQLADYKDDPTGADDQLAFGLLRADGSKKPSYWAVCNTMRVLYCADETFTPRPLAARLEGDLHGVRHVLLQKANGRYDLLLWQEAQSYEQPYPKNQLQYREIECAKKQVTLTFDKPVVWAQLFYPSALDGRFHEARGPVVTISNPITLALEVPDELMIVRVAPVG